MMEAIYGFIGAIAFIIGGFFIGWAKVYNNRPMRSRLSVFCGGISILCFSAFFLTMIPFFSIMGFILMGLMFIIGRGGSE